MALTSLIAVVVILGFLSNSVQSFQFELQPSKSKCVVEEMRKHAMTVGKYAIVKPNADQPLPETHKISVTVNSLSGVNYHITAPDAEKGQFSFEALEEGEYYACFWWRAHEHLAPIMISFDWDVGIDVKELSKVASKGDIKITEYSVRPLVLTAGHIQNEMRYLHQRVIEMQRYNLETNSILGWSSLLSLFICLSVITLQVWHLKTFFQKKKLI